MTRPIVLLLALAGSTLQGQHQPLVGVWRISFPAGMRVENGVPTPIIGSGTLTIEAKGDSLIGDLVADSLPGRPARPPAHLAAAAGSGQIVFNSRTKAMVNINGDLREVTALSDWTLQAKGDSLSGTLRRRLEGFDDGNPEPGPVTGTRRKSK